MIKFQYNDDGVLEAWEDDTKIGEVITMGDDVTKKEEQTTEP